MKKLILLLPLFLIGCSCFKQKPPENPPADRPIYKPYTFDVPERPVLDSDKIQSSSDGVVVRTIESDMSKLIEYAKKLENVLNAIPKSIEIKQ